METAFANPTCMMLRFCFLNPQPGLGRHHRGACCCLCTFFLSPSLLAICRVNPKRVLRWAQNSWLLFSRLHKENYSPGVSQKSLIQHLLFITVTVGVYKCKVHATLLFQSLGSVSAFLLNDHLKSARKPFFFLFWFGLHSFTVMSVSKKSPVLSDQMGLSGPMGWSLSECSQSSQLKNTRTTSGLPHYVGSPGIGTRPFQKVFLANSGNVRDEANASLPSTLRQKAIYLSSVFKA